jgi:hypothetical protein
MTDETNILKASHLQTGVDENAVYFTLEESVLKAIENGSDVIQVHVKGSNEGVVWLHHTDSDMLTDLRHYPEHYGRLLRAAKRIHKREEVIE